MNLRLSRTFSRLITVNSAGVGKSLVAATTGRGRTLLLALTLQLVFASLCCGEVIRMEREELIQRSDLIFVGEVTAKNCRRNALDTMIVTDYEFQIDEILFGEHAGNTITLTFAGGILGEEGQAVSGVPEFQLGEVVLFMKAASEVPLFSPLAGSWQGKYSAMKIAGKTLAFEPTCGCCPISARGVPVLVNDDAVAFSDFVELVRQEIPVARSKPLPDRTVPAELQHLVLRDLPEVPYEIGDAINYVAEAQIPEADLEILETPEPEVRRNDDQEFENDQNLGGGFAEGIYMNRASTVPIVFEAWPDSFPQWSRSHDQFAMSFWNRYADIFRVSESNGWAWENGVYEMTGFPTSATMLAQFGQSWSAGTLATAFTQYSTATGLASEVDIAVNPAFSWTTNDYSIYRNLNLYNLDRTLTHELGHGWGLQHQFNDLSVMNYAQHKYRAYNVIQRDDAATLRAAYSSRAVDVRDLGISLFRSDGFQFYADSNISTNVLAPGESVTVSNFVIENPGTDVMDPVVDWYLVPEINSWAGAIFIRQTTHATLNPTNAFLTARTMTIPNNVVSGTYYIGALIRNADDAVSENNSSWLDRPIQVTEPHPRTVVTNGMMDIIANDNHNEIIVTQAGIGNVTVEVDGDIQSFSGIIGVNVFGFEGFDLIASNFPGIAIYGMGGNDEITFFGSGPSQLIGGTGNDIIRGGSGPDLIYGSSGDDEIFGRAGNDTIHGGTGDDVIRGISGRNIIFGNAGNDEIIGGTGPDEIDGALGLSLIHI